MQPGPCLTFLITLLFYQVFMIKSFFIKPLRLKLHHVSLSITDNNSGVVLVEKRFDIAVIWKSGNIAINKDTFVRRAAGLDIESWSVSNLYQESPDQLRQPFIYTSLTTPYAGLIILPRTAQAKFLLQNNNFLIYSFVCLVSTQNRTEDIQRESFPNDISVVIKESVPSVTYGFISLAEIQVRRVVTCENLCEILKSKGYLVIGSVEGMKIPPCLSLTGIRTNNQRLQGETSPLTDSSAFNSSDTSDTYIPSSFDLNFDLNVSVEIPKKYMKIMKRELLFHQRAAVLKSVLNNVDPSASVGTNGIISNNNRDEREIDISQSDQIVSFRTLPYSMPQNGLVPRESSGVLVDEAIDTINTFGRRCRVLDLGTGIGTLLLALLNECPAALGTGVELDDTLLTYARHNEEKILGSPSESGDSLRRCRWVRGNFFQLEVLVDISSSAYDIIVCNPPFLPSRSAASRVTAESDLALVSGPLGTEAYSGICAAILRCNTQERRLLAEDGVLVFQLPYGERLQAAVLLAVTGSGFKVVRFRFDSRGVRRAVICVLSGTG